MDANLQGKFVQADRLLQYRPFDRAIDGCRNVVAGWNASCSRNIQDRSPQHGFTILLNSQQGNLDDLLYSGFGSDLIIW